MHQTTASRLKQHVQHQTTTSTFVPLSQEEETPSHLFYTPESQHDKDQDAELLAPTKYQQYWMLRVFALIRRFLCCQNDDLTETTAFGVPLHSNEQVLYFERPQYAGNVIVLALLALCFFTVIIFVPVAVFLHVIDLAQHWPTLYSLVWLTACLVYIFCIIYLVLYKLLYIRLYCVRYMMTTERCIITGVGNESALLVNGNANIFRQVIQHVLHWIRIPYQEWRYDEMDHVYFSIGNKRNKQSTATPGNIYFGYKIENFTLPFSVISYATMTGFITVPNVYTVLDILIRRVESVTSARMVRSDFADMPNLKPFVIGKTNSLCGNSMFGWFKQAPLQGKLSSEDYYQYKGDIVDLEE